MDKFAALQAMDPYAVGIKQSRPVVISFGKGKNLDEVIYQDKWGKTHKTFLEY